MHLTKSRFAEVYGPSKEPIDDIVRGFIAGGASLLFSKDVEAVETKCISKGDRFCEIVVQSKEKFDLSKKLIKNQLGLI